MALGLLILAHRAPSNHRRRGIEAGAKCWTGRGGGRLCFETLAAIDSRTSAGRTEIELGKPVLGYSGNEEGNRLVLVLPPALRRGLSRSGCLGGNHAIHLHSNPEEARC